MVWDVLHSSMGADGAFGLMALSVLVLILPALEGWPKFELTFHVVQCYDGIRKFQDHVIVKQLDFKCQTDIIQ